MTWTCRSGAIYGLTATTLAVLWLGAGNSPVQLPFLIALLVALCVPLLAGAINAFFTTVVGIPAFIATLGMLSIAQGIELLISRCPELQPPVQRAAADAR